MNTLVVVACTALSVVLAVPTDVEHKQPEGYFMYLNVPRHKEYEAGFNRGNAKHQISRFEQLKDHRFRTRVKWHDAHDGYGEHYFEYNHGPKYPEQHQNPVYHEPVYHQEPAAHH